MMTRYRAPLWAMLCLTLTAALGSRLLAADPTLPAASALERIAFIGLTLATPEPRPRIATPEPPR